MATDDLHAPLGLKRPAAGWPILYSVAAAVLGVATAAVVIGAAAWYEPLSRGLPAPPQASTPAAMPAAVKPEPPAAASAPITARVVQVPGTAAPPSRPLPQVTGSVLPVGAPDGAKEQPAAPGSTERIITIIDGRSGARQEVRIPVTSDAAIAPLPYPGPADPMRNVPDADEAPEPLPLPQSPPSRPKPSAPQKRAAKPGATLSTNSASQAPLR